MHFSGRVSIFWERDVEQETTTKTAFILAKVINRIVAKTEASFLLFGQNI